MNGSGKKGGKVITRRDFIKKTAAGAALAYAGINGSNLILKPGANAQSADQFRVVMVQNSALATSLTNGWESQRIAINNDMVISSMNQALTCLTQTTSAATAWQRIVPNSKPYNETAVAIKVNYLSSNLASHPQAVLWAVNGLLSLGIQASNIYIYDSHNSNTLDWLYASIGSPAGISCRMRSEASYYYSIAGWNTRLVDIIHDDTVDWLINIAVPKGHGTYVAGFTMCMKNHFGTFSPASHSVDNYLRGINAHDKILTKTILNINDAIYASRSTGPSSPTTHWPRKIFMGKSALATDYLVAKYLLLPPESAGGLDMAASGYNLNMAMIESWANEPAFGITPSQLRDLPLITACSSDTTPPKAPTNLIVNPA